MASTSVDCLICFETFPLDKIITCFCGRSSCFSCAKSYILSTDQYAHCMDCKGEWNNAFLLKNFNKSWVNSNREGGYRAHLKTVAFAKEKAKIPDVLPKMPYYKEQEQLNEVALQYRTELKKQQEIINQTRQKLAQTEAELRRITKILQGDVHLPSEPKLVCPCPVIDCRGSIRDDNFCCIICTKKICKRCREAKEEGHRCDSATLENLKLIIKECKPCPKCAVPIDKKDGCDQMWCSQCKTAFSWNTGKIETGPIHNPHAIQWYRENGGLVRDLQDVPCGGLITINAFKIPTAYSAKFDYIYRTVAECDRLLTGYQPNNDMKNLCVAFLFGKINESEWEQKIFLRQRLNERKREARNIIDLFRNLGIERFRNLYEELRPLGKDLDTVSEKINDFFIEMERVRLLINEIFMVNLTAVGTANPIQISETWRWNTSKTRRNTALHREVGIIVDEQVIAEQIQALREFEARDR